MSDLSFCHGKLRRVREDYVLVTDLATSVPEYRDGVFRIGRDRLVLDQGMYDLSSDAWRVGEYYYFRFPEEDGELLQVKRRIE